MMCLIPDQSLTDTTARRELCFLKKEFPALRVVSTDEVLGALPEGVGEEVLELLGLGLCLRALELVRAWKPEVRWCLHREVGAVAKSGACGTCGRLVGGGADRRLDVLLCLRNTESWLRCCFPAVRRNLERAFAVRWFVYENDSTDRTKQLLRETLLEPPGACPACQPRSGDRVYLEDVRYEGSRCEKLAQARNALHRLYFADCGEDVPQWCLLVDADIALDAEHTVRPLLTAAAENPDGVMFCANGQTVCDKTAVLATGSRVFEGVRGRKYMVDYYYDTFALDYGEYYLSDHVNLVLEHRFGGGRVAEFLTAFGGVVLVDRLALGRSRWSASSPRAHASYGVCEHYDFCDAVRRFGKLYVVKDSLCAWGEENQYVGRGTTFHPHFLRSIQEKKLLQRELLTTGERAARGCT